LWSISGPATQAFVVDFCTDLLAGVLRGTALENAQWRAFDAPARRPLSTGRRSSSRATTADYRARS
jgi:hypothetical protein